jgi:hypothetical protein
MDGTMGTVGSVGSAGSVGSVARVRGGRELAGGGAQGTADMGQGARHG